MVKSPVRPHPANSNPALGERQESSEVAPHASHIPKCRLNVQARGRAWQAVYVAAQRAGRHRVEGAGSDLAGDCGAQLLLQPLFDLIASLQESANKWLKSCERLLADTKVCCLAEPFASQVAAASPHGHGGRCGLRACTTIQLVSSPCW
jgi:hypothetical protein